MRKNALREWTAAFIKKKFQRESGVADILGVRVNLVNYTQTIGAMESAIQEQRKLTISFINVYSIMAANRDEKVREAINSSSLSVADGMPLVWISKWTDTPLSNRVYGPDLFERFCGLSEGKGYSHFFYGSSPKVLNLLTQTIRQRFPRIRIVGFISPPYRPLYGQEENRFIEEINESGADVLWVGLGCPKQEKWMVSVRDRIRVPVIAAIGAAFDFHAGVVKQAPPFWQKHGLEWLFRLLQEPRRLSIRYLVYNPWFLIRLTKQILK